jgi:acyl-coenzyme A thioesterase PaaI-like protein
MDTSLQDRYAPTNICFGCGPANKKGLQIKSFVEGEEVVAQWKPQAHHQAFPGAMNGGILGALFDCHSNWTAAWHLMRKAGLDAPPSTVTAEFYVRLLAPTPSDQVLQLRAKVSASTMNSATISASLGVGGKVTATCRGVFVVVKEGHPAFHRW